MNKLQISIFMVSAVFALTSCEKSHSNIDIEEPETSKQAFSKQGLAKIMSSLPLQEEHLNEVFDAVNNSSGNGFDEEYMIRDLFEAPGCGVGGATRAATTYSSPIKNLLTDYLRNNYTKTKSGDVQEYIDSLCSSGMQIYWPYSENWDGKTYPVITFDPGYGVETNYGYEISFDGSGYRVVDSIEVNEAVAKTRPVWVINSNLDSGLKPAARLSTRSPAITPNATNRCLKLRSFKMLRQYDSWFQGASEFSIKIGGVDGMTASTEAELKLYTPSITDFVVVVKRNQVGKEIFFDSIMMTDFTNQLEKLAFLITEDDGGTRTSWKCSAIVKVQSKSYGFELELPYNDKDDIVWRGQIAASYLQSEDTVTGRFGDVMVTFELD